MALDPSIPLRAMEQQTRLMMPWEHQQNALALQAKQMQIADAQAEAQARQQQRMQQNALAQALGSPKARTADGGFDYGYLSNAPGIAPENALKFDLQRQENVIAQEKARREKEKAQFERQKQQLELIGQVAGAATDQNTYSQGLATLQSFGIDTSKLPQQYNADYVAQARNQILTAQQQLEQAWKDKNYQLDVTKQQEIARNNRAQNAISQGNLLVAQGNLGLRQQELAKPQYDSARGVMVNRNGIAVPVTTASGAPIPAAKPKAPMSATLQKELIQTDEEIQSGTAALDLINKAKTASDKAFSGYFAMPRAVLASNLGIEGEIGEAANATVDLNNIATSQALEILKSTFGAAPTEGERKILLDLQGSPDKTPAQRMVIYQRAEEAIKRRLAIAKGKSRAIRSGTYLTEEYDQSSPTQPATQQQPAAKAKTGSNVVQVRTVDDYNRLPSGAVFIDPNGVQRRKK